MGLKMNDGAELRIHPTGKAILKISSKTQGQGHETTFAQIVAEELGIQPEDVKVQHGDTDNTPYGLGTYASRSTPTVGAATAMVSRRILEKAQEARRAPARGRPRTTSSSPGRSSRSRARPRRRSRSRTSRSPRTRTSPTGWSRGSRASYYYDPPNLTFPFGTYVVAVEVDPETGVWEVARMVAVDDCGVRINPMIVEGQIHGGLTEGYAIAAMQQITFDEDGNCIGSNFLDYLLPTAVETPKFELGETVTPSPHHPIGAKGVGESATVGSPAAFVNAVIDALWPLGVRNIDMPLTSAKVWEAMQAAKAGVVRVRADVLRLAAELERAGRGLRARDGGVAAGTVLGEGGRDRADQAPSGGSTGGSAAHAPSPPWSARRCGRSRRDAAAAVPRSARGARRATSATGS